MARVKQKPVKRPIAAKSSAQKSYKVCARTSFPVLENG
jgi:hypothetical protein